MITLTCAHCQADRPAHLMTCLRYAGSGASGNRPLVLCPQCYGRWFRREQRRAVQMELHARGIDGRRARAG